MKNDYTMFTWKHAIIMFGILFVINVLFGGCTQMPVRSYAEAELMMEKKTASVSAMIRPAVQVKARIISCTHQDAGQGASIREVADHKFENDQVIDLPDGMPYFGEWDAQVMQLSPNLLGIRFANPADYAQGYALFVTIDRGIIIGIMEFYEYGTGDQPTTFYAVNSDGSVTKVTEDTMNKILELNQLQSARGV